MKEFNELRYAVKCPLLYSYVKNKKDGCEYQIKQVTNNYIIDTVIKFISQYNNRKHPIKFDNYYNKFKSDVLSDYYLYLKQHDLHNTRVSQIEKQYIVICNVFDDLYYRCRVMFNEQTNCISQINTNVYISKIGWYRVIPLITFDSIKGIYRIYNFTVNDNAKGTDFQKHDLLFQKIAYCENNKDVDINNVETVLLHIKRNKVLPRMVKNINPHKFRFKQQVVPSGKVKRSQFLDKFSIYEELIKQPLIPKSDILNCRKCIYRKVCQDSS